jgi:integrase
MRNTAQKCPVAGSSPQLQLKEQVDMKGVRPFADEEITAIKASFSGRYAARDRAPFVVGLQTGFRISELLSLRRKDVCARGKVFDRVSVERKHMKKKTQGRTVLLHPEARAALSGATAPSPISPASEVMN